MRRIGHQHAIAASQRQIGGQRRAFIAAFFLDDLNKQHLAPVNHVLDLVPATQGHALAPQIFGRRMIIMTIAAG